MLDIFEKAGLAVEIPLLGECVCIKDCELPTMPGCEIRIRRGEIFDIELKTTDYVSLKQRNVKFFVKMGDYERFFQEAAPV